MDLFAWFRKESTWRQEHVAAFREAAHIQADGLTRFQHQCMTAIAPYVPSASYRRVACSDGDYLVAPFGPKNVKVFIYPNEAGLWGPETDLPLEEWSYKLPDDITASLVRECASRAT